jgi:hypothetical protein
MTSNEFDSTTTCLRFHLGYHVVYCKEDNNESSLIVVMPSIISEIKRLLVSFFWVKSLHNRWRHITSPLIISQPRKAQLGYCPCAEVYFQYGLNILYENVCQLWNFSSFLIFIIQFSSLFVCAASTAKRPITDNNNNNNNIIIIIHFSFLSVAFSCILLCSIRVCL